MGRSRADDPLTLFSLALAERDWVLADLVAATRWRNGPRREAYERLLQRASAPGAPRNLERLHRWAQLVRSLERVSAGEDDHEDA